MKLSLEIDSLTGRVYEGDDYVGIVKQRGDGLWRWRLKHGAAHGTADLRREALREFNVALAVTRAME